MSDKKSLSLGYLNAISEWAGGSTDPAGNRVIFPCIEGTRGIMAGAGVPISVIQNGVALKADALLKDGNPWYQPSPELRYSQALASYLTYVSLPEGSKAAKAVVEQKQKNHDAKSTEVRERLRAARKEHSTDDMGLKDFAQFVKEMYPEIETARFLAKEAENELYNAQIASGIPGYESLAVYKKKLLPIQEAVRAPGITMSIATNSFVYNASLYIDYIRQGNKAVVVNDIDEKDRTYAAAFTLSPDYPTTLDRWFAEFPNNMKKVDGYKHSIEIKTSDGTEQSSTKSGHDEKTIQSSVGWWWFSVSTSKTETHDWKESTTSSAKGSVTVTMYCMDKGVFEVRPSIGWDIPGYRKLFPNVTDACPPEIKNLVQPVEMLCASGVKLRVELSGDKKSSFDTEYKTAKTNGGTFKLFGFEFGADNGPSSETKTSHNGSWNAETGVLEVLPTSYEGNCSLLAMIGKRTSS